jgi:PAS domain-containing protein
VSTGKHKHLVLILARSWASNLATPVFIADETGTVVYYNEAAEDVTGAPFSEAGERPMDDWTASFAPRTPDAEPIPAEERPARIALDERRPAYRRFRVTNPHGVEGDVEVTALPLFAHADEFVGIVVIFWPAEGEG